MKMDVNKLACHANDKTNYYLELSIKEKKRKLMREEANTNPSKTVKTHIMINK